MANFTKPMKWNNKGIEPSETLKNQGFKGGYKPPAEVFNYFFNNSEICVDELQKASDEAQSTADSAKAAADKAQSTASSAATVASSAQSTAESAGTAAALAQATADGAQSTANSAKAAADKAQSTAEGKADGTHKHKKSDITDFPTSMTPTSHSSTNTTYGLGSSSNYGHVKLSDSTTSTSGVSSGVAATPAAVKNVKTIADEAKSTADSAKAEADKAQNTASSAATAASSAQSTAESAGTTAALAQAAANEAQSSADSAKAAADKAQRTADDAKMAADNAQSTAGENANDILGLQNKAKNFLTKDDIDVEDVALKSKDIFGKNSRVTGSPGSGTSATTYPSGLVPSSAVTSSQINNEYLREDGTWHTPFMVITGQQGSQNAQSNYTMKFSGNFSGVRYVELFAPDGTLGMSATVDPKTNKTTTVANYHGYVSGVDEQSINIFVGHSNLNGKWTYVAYKFD